MQCLLYTCRGAKDVGELDAQVLNDRLHHICPKVSSAKVTSIAATHLPQLVAIRLFSGTIGVPPTPGLSTAITRTPYFFATGSAECD